MITRKALAAKLEEMGKTTVLVSQNDYHNTHPLCATPLQKKLAELIGAQSIEARRYTTRRGVSHTSPAWLVAAYKKLAILIHNGNDINVRMMISVIGQ